MYDLPGAGPADRGIPDSTGSCVDMHEKGIRRTAIPTTDTVRNVNKNAGTSKFETCGFRETEAELDLAVRAGRVTRACTGGVLPQMSCDAPCESYTGSCPSSELIEANR